VRVLLGNGPWMTWNVALALAPLALAMLLFGQGRRRTVWWWIGAAAFVVFLPNAPYVITDAIHLSGDLAAVRGETAITMAVLLEYGILISIGVCAYAASLHLLRRDLLERGYPAAAVRGTELALHAACAVGVLLGRYARFNSWDLGTRFDDVAGHLGTRLDRPISWALLVSTFTMLVVCSMLARLLATGAAVEWSALRSRRHP